MNAIAAALTTALMLIPAAARADAEVVATGAMRSAIADGGVATVPVLAAVTAEPHLYALGPVAGMRGEITVFDSQPWVARVVDGGVMARPEPDAGAAFLVQACVTAWQSQTLPTGFDDEAALARQVRAAATASGIAAEVPFPFIIEAPSAAVTYHVLDRKPGAATGHAAHAAGKAVFTIEAEAVTLLGFWSDRHEGVFTHRGAHSHVHVLSADRGRSGHVDALRLPPGSVLKLPRG